MKRNPLLPFALIAVLGVGIMFILSFQGLNKADKLTKEKDGGGKTEVASNNPEDIVKSTCISCHGNNLEGSVGPALDKIGSKLKEDEIKDILVNGKGSGMPGNLLQGDQAKVDAVAKWLSEKK